MSTGVKRSNPEKSSQVAKKQKVDDTNWSTAKKHAFKLIESNPNSYFYRFNKPDEEAKRGEWSDQEIKTFMKLLKKRGANSRWGIFSQEIEGRVGYTCAQKYRNLMKQGWIFDRNYIWCGNEFKLLRQSSCNLSVQKYQQHKQWGFIVLHDPTETFETLPYCDIKGNEFMKTLLKHEKVVNHKVGSPVKLPHDCFSHVVTFPDGCLDQKEADALKVKNNIKLVVDKASKLTLDVERGNLISDKKIEKRENEYSLQIICNSVLQEIATFKDEADEDNVWKQWLVDEGKQLLEDHITLRQTSVDKFKEFPCQFTYDSMCFAHGIIDNKKYFNNETVKVFKDLMQETNVASLLSSIDMDIKS